MSYPMKVPPMERKPDGSLYRMTPKQHREAVRLHRQPRQVLRRLQGYRPTETEGGIRQMPQGGESKDRGVKHE